MLSDAAASLAKYDHADYLSKAGDKLERTSGYGGSFSGSGYGGGGAGSGYYRECCPLVVDPLTLFAILACIGFFAAFLNVVITMTDFKRKRRRRSPISTAEERFSDVVHSGREGGRVSSRVDS